MCYAIPGLVVGIDKNIVTVDYFGERRKARNEFYQIRLGDYVYAQGGFVVQKIPKSDAILILKEWKKRFKELKKLDLKISRRRGKAGVDGEFIHLIEKAKDGVELKKEEMLRLLQTNDKEELDLLFRVANELRQQHLKNSCCIHGIIEFSNYCRNDCAYCGIRKSNDKLNRYRMDINEIVQVADNAVNELGFKALVLQSGEDPWYTPEKLVEIIKKILEKCGVLLFMSVGSRSRECYKKMYDAGARGVLLRFETANPVLYEKLHFGPKADFRARIELLRYARKLGYIIATGSLIGLPGQKAEDLLNDILLTKSLDAEMYSFGPLIPHPETPLAEMELSGINRVLKVLAVSRLIDKDAKILVTTALETLDKENGRKLGLLAGANSLMINVTPTRYRKQYTLYPGRPDRDKEIIKNIDDTLKLLYSLGRAPTDIGFGK